MRIEKCNFCSANVYPGKGTVFVRNDARKFRFCRKKCRLAFMKKKNPVRTKWTKASRISKNKELSAEISEVFEKRRIFAERYDSEAMKQTLQVLPEVLKMIQKKKDHHILKRLAVGTEHRKERDLYYVKNKIHLIRAPHAKESEDVSDSEDNMEGEEVVDIESEDETMDVDEEIKVLDVLQSSKESVTAPKVKARAEIYEMS